MGLGMYSYGGKLSHSVQYDDTIDLSRYSRMPVRQAHNTADSTHTLTCTTHPSSPTCANASAVRPQTRGPLRWTKRSVGDWGDEVCVQSSSANAMIACPHERHSCRNVCCGAIALPVVSYHVTQPGSVTGRLLGFVVHLGSGVGGGHYIAYVRTASGQWYCMDDSQVYQVSVPQAMSREAYIVRNAVNAAASVCRPSSVIS